MEEALSIVNAVKPSGKYRHIARILPYVRFLSGVALLRVTEHGLFPTLLTCDVVKPELSESLPAILHNVMAAVPPYRVAMQNQCAASNSSSSGLPSPENLSPELLGLNGRENLTVSMHDALDRTHQLGAIVVWTPSLNDPAGNRLRVDVIKGLIEGGGVWIASAATSSEAAGISRHVRKLQADGWPVTCDGAAIKLLCPVTFVVRTGEPDQLVEHLGDQSLLCGMDVADLLATGTSGQLRVHDNLVRACLIEPNDAVQFHDWARARFGRPVPPRMVPLVAPHNGSTVLENPYCPGTWVDPALLLPDEPPWHYLYRGNAFVWAIWHLMVMHEAEIIDGPTPLYRSHRIPAGVQLLDAVVSVLKTVGAHISTHAGRTETVGGLLSLVRNTAMLRSKASGALMLNNNSVDRLPVGAAALTDRTQLSDGIVAKAFNGRSYG